MEKINDHLDISFDEIIHASYGNSCGMIQRMEALVFDLKELLELSDLHVHSS